MFDVVTLGELLVDFTPAGYTEQKYPLYIMNPGGAPANVAVGAARLGASSAFLGKVGADSMGIMLQKVMDKNGVDTRGLIVDKGLDTMFTLVQLGEAGDRSFRFFRDNSADVNFHTEEVNKAVIHSSRALHVGSISMTQEPTRSATLSAVRIAHESGAAISFDPNIRLELWKSTEDALSAICALLPLCDILKVSEEELMLLSGRKEIDSGMEYIAKKNNIPLVFVTLGPQGCQWRFHDSTGMACAYDVNTVDTTGAGDSFIGAVLFALFHQHKGLETLNTKDMEEIADFACAASSLTTAGRGAISSMPNAAQVEALRLTGRHI